MRIWLTLIFLLTQLAHGKSLSNQAYGPISIGMAAKQALQYLEGYQSTQGLYDDESDCYYLSPVDGEIGVHYMVIDDYIARFDIDDESPHIKTAKDIGVGSSKTEVLKAYPNTQISPHPYMAPDGEYLEVRLSNGNGIIFETDHDVVTSFRLGSYPTESYTEGCS